LNGLTLNAVGSGTVIEYIQLYKGSDDGMEFFGGTVNVRYAVSTGNTDDAFDWTFGWRGNGQFWVADHATGDKGIEADGHETEFERIPFAHPVLSNITFIKQGGSQGILLRRGTQAEIYNAVVTGYGTGLRVEDTPLMQTHVTNADIIVQYSTFFGNTTGYDGIVNPFSTDVSNSGNTVTFSNRFVSTESSEFDPNDLDNWFVSAPFRGGVDSSNDWTLGWVRNLDGSIR
jgi:hypothetical protein